MKENNNKGFTLIELLAVIVILSAIALIVTPTVTGIIQESKISIAKTDILNYVDIIEKTLSVNNALNQTKYADGYYAINGSLLNDQTIKYTGEGPSKGKIFLSNNRVETGNFCIKGIPVHYEDKKTYYEIDADYCNSDKVYEDGTPKVWKITDTNSNGKGDIGEQVCIQDECFYIYNTDNNQYKLLAQYNLQVGEGYTNGNNMQDAAATGYTSGNCIGTTSYGSSPVYEKSAVKPFIDIYKTKLVELGMNEDTEVGLITKEEVLPLISSFDKSNNVITSDYPFIYSTDYWLGTPDGEYYEWAISKPEFPHLKTETSSTYYLYGVRPAIIINQDEAK